MMQHLRPARQKIWILTVILLMAVLILPQSAAPTLAAGPVKTDLIGSTTVADIAESSSPKVVWITTTYERQQSPGRNFFFYGQSQPAQGIGSGFFFKDDGYILTNAHVVADAKTIQVILKDQDTPLTAKQVGIDQELDIAVIKVDLPSKIKPLKLGNSDAARVGDWVIAIGNPNGLDHTVTVGIISAKGRPIVAGEDNSGAYQTYDNMIQTDAAINPGNSGGPLLNLAGEVIGINSAVDTNGQGLGFAIPINSVQAVLNELIAKGKISRAWLGVTVIDIKALDARTRTYLGLEKSEGVLINPVKDSPADKAGLQQYDVVQQINHTNVTNTNDFVNLIKKQKVGDKITLLVLRGGILKTFEVVLGEKP